MCDPTSHHPRVVRQGAYRPGEILELLNSEHAGAALYFAKPIALFIMGPCYKIASVSFFERMLEEKPVAEGLTIVVVPNCCANYGSGFEGELRRALPNYNWDMPTVADYCEIPQVGHVMEDLLRFGFLDTVT